MKMLLLLLCIEWLQPKISVKKLLDTLLEHIIARSHLTLFLTLMTNHDCIALNSFGELIKLPV